jgi:nucleoside-diphosphate-sugar epimerase
VRVLVSGAGGFLGRYIVQQLLERGHSVRAIIRPASPEPARSRKVEIFRADLRNAWNLTSAFADMDSVIHAAAATSGSEEMQFASTVVGTENLLNAMAQTSVRRLVHVSSLVVYDWSRARRILDEQSALLEDIYGMGAYTIAKVWQERVVAKIASAHSFKVTIMRPGFIWGPQHAEIAGMGRRLHRVYFMFGPFTRLPLCHVVNCANSVVTALESSNSIGEVFNVTDSDDVRVWRYVREYRMRTGQRGVLLPVPYHFGLGLAYLASIASRFLFGTRGRLPSLLMPRRYQSQFKPIRFSNRKLILQLPWLPPLNFGECLSSTYSGPTRSPSP